MTSTITTTETGATVCSGKDAAAVFQAVAIARALRTYAATGMKMNRAYTPGNMLAMAEKITGKTFKRGKYVEAADALKEWADARQGVTVNVR